MAKVTVGLPQGTRDFGPEVVRKRNYILNTIKNVFELYGFQPLETPAMENLETLMGKYGEEGDKLIFRILDSGDPFSNDFIKAFSLWMGDREEKLSSERELEASKRGYVATFKNQISSKALKYDLTIPFARYVAMNHGKLSFPFKRYQIQPVWRADRPQKGRYREFYQCDADIVGSHSLLNEVELTNIYATVFQQLGIPVEIKINSRKILAALAEQCGGTDKLVDITIAIDKLDKIGLEKVKEELIQRGLNDEQIDFIEHYLRIEGNNEEKSVQIKNLMGDSLLGKKGIEELEFVLQYSTNKDLPIVLDFTLARGLNYYTGIIFEIKANNVQMGSIGGGGRYDDLTGLFGVPNIPGVGISFGVDRIYDVMEELNLFPTEVHTGTQVLFFNLGEAESRKAFELMQRLRNNNTRCELFHETAKFDKQFKYAEKKNIPYIIIIGSKELVEGNCNIKDLRSGGQTTVPVADLINFSFI
ncbi:histidine--tRNA ligase [Terrimonas pollutisoli]|uniref:histidine--tRNA ligase n=1 Tax=Terrimonas pollutisoli TaxID=3034147 RepID=UPI0023EA91F6|nr:histidine--tRNA ligase [Terrimonas sp. H1YJ31]